MVRAFLAVIAGYAAIGILVTLTDLLFSLLVPGWKAMARPPLYYFVASLGTDFLYSVFGGYVCVVIARERAKAAALGLMIVGELIGLASQIALWKTVPHWFGIALLILYPPAIWLGSRLHKNQGATA